MAEPWIRVHANIGDKPVVARASRYLSVNPNEAIGLLVCFWGAVSQHAIGGKVDQYDDERLEAWAGWNKRGKKGLFASFIRSLHLDADGRVNEWDEYAGALESRRERERIRLRNKREERKRNVAQQASYNDQPRTQDVAQPLRNVRTRARERDDTKRSSISQSVGDAPISVAEIETEIGDKLANDAERNALTDVLARSNSPLACAAALDAILSGNDTATPQPSAEQFGQAVFAFAANGERWNAALFRGYLKRIVARSSEKMSDEWIPPSELAGTTGTTNGPNGRANGARAPATPANDRRTATLGGARNDATIDAWIRKGEAADTAEGTPHGE